MPRTLFRKNAATLFGKNAAEVVHKGHSRRSKLVEGNPRITEQDQHSVDRNSIVENVVPVPLLLLVVFMSRRLVFTPCCFLRMIAVVRILEDVVTIPVGYYCRCDSFSRVEVYDGGTTFSNSSKKLRKGLGSSSFIFCIAVCIACRTRATLRIL